jgi:hypothetical protein
MMMMMMMKGLSRAGVEEGCFFSPTSCATPMRASDSCCLRGQQWEYCGLIDLCDMQRCSPVLWACGGCSLQAGLLVGNQRQFGVCCA